MEEESVEVPSMNYDEDELQCRRNLVLSDLNKYIGKKFPQLIDATIVEKPSKSRSVLDLCGVCVLQHDSGKPFFLCLMGKCFVEREAIKITKQSTYNATNHLLSKHNVVASKTEAHQRNVSAIRKHIKGADGQFQCDPACWFEVNLSAFVYENSIAFRAFDSPLWKVIASKLPTGTKSLQRINIRKHYLEHYVSI
jgi:hypothetical protein